MAERAARDCVDCCPEYVSSRLTGNGELLIEPQDFQGEKPHFEKADRLAAAEVQMPDGAFDLGNIDIVFEAAAGCLQQAPRGDGRVDRRADAIAEERDLLPGAEGSGHSWWKKVWRPRRA